MSLEKNDDTFNYEELEKGIDQTMNEFQENTVIKATVIQISQDTVFLDFGYKSEAKIPLSEFDEVPEKGDEIEVFLMKMENDNGDPYVSRNKALSLKGKDELRVASKEHKAVKGKVSQVKRGGFQVKYDNVTGFIPFRLFDFKRIENPEEYVGMDIEFYIDKVSSNVIGGKGDKDDFVGDRKSFLSNYRRERQKTIFEEIKSGDVVEGTVKNITNFGAFIDLGGIEGLLHIRDIAWVKIDKVEDVLSVGDKVRVKVLDMNPEKMQISLGLKHMEEQPWDKFAASYKEGDVVTGQITSIVPYGAFVKIIDGVEGLLHISDLSWTKNVKTPKEIVQDGQQVEVKIIKIDEDAKKINVSLKHLLNNPWDNVEKKYSVDTVVEGTVKNITVFGAFVELEEGVEALLHKEEISWTEKYEPKNYFTIGEKVKAKVIFCDVDEKKIKLGIKQLEENPWQSVSSNVKSNEIIECTIEEVDVENGLVVSLKDGLSTTIPLKNVDYSKIDEIKETLNENFKVGDKIKAVVKSFDPSRQIIDLSLKDYQKVEERKKVQEYMHNDDDTTFTLGDMIKDKEE